MDQAHHHGDEQIIRQVIEAEQAWLRAHLQCDVALLDHLMAAEYTQITESGGIRTKAQVLDSFRSGKRHWTTAQSDDYDVRVYGETALVIGRWQAKGTNDEQAFDYAARYVSVWIWRDGRWQMVSDQATPIAS